MKLLIFITAHFMSIVLFLKLISYLIPSAILSYYTFACNISLCVVVSFLSFSFSKRLFLKDKIRTSNKAVFITGCDSGFGNLLARRLDFLGFHVFAGCLFPSGEGATDLKKSCSNNLHILEVDVTKDESVKRAAQITQENLGPSIELWAIVNNAGIQKGFIIELTPFEWFQEVLDVNTFGHIRMCQAFLPLLRQSKGRVVNITSAAGRFAHPHMTPYCVSKYASQAFNDCLRMELLSFGVDVISIEPQPFESSITDPNRIRKAFDAMLETVDDRILSSYKGKYIEKSKALQELFIRCTSRNVKLVIDDIEAAITSKYPNSSYQTRSNMLFRVSMKIMELLPPYAQDMGFRTVELFSPLLTHLYDTYGYESSKLE